IVVPQVIRPYVTERVLVLELIEGKKVEREHGLAPDRAHELARQFFKAYVHQVTVEGVYHADPHRGNVFLTRDGRLALLDFGLLGRLDQDTRRGLALLLLAIAQTLYPEMDPVELLAEDALEVMLIEAERRLEPNELFAWLYTQLEPLTRMPRRLGHLVTELERGSLTVGVQPTGLGELEAN